MQNKKKSAQPRVKMVKANSINRLRAFVYDVYAKCMGVERIVINDIIAHHKCNNNIPKSLNGKFIKKTKVTIKDQRGYHWIGPVPDEKIIQAIDNEVRGLKKIQNNKRKTPITKNLLDKANPQSTKQTLEFLFDQDSDATIDTIENIEPENKEVLMSKMMELFKKFMGK